MDDQLTPWEDINPPMVSAPRHELPCKSSDIDPRTVFRNELTACLTLVAPVGMNEEARRDWFAVAWDALKHIPPSILTIGARKAREQCDHPAKIVPTIIAETREWMIWRDRSPRDAPDTRALPAPEPKYVTPEEAAKILDEYGLKRDQSVNCSGSGA